MIPRCAISDAIRRILAQHYRPGQDSGGPSRLTFLGHMKDNLWSMDLFRCESPTLSAIRAIHDDEEVHS